MDIVDEVIDWERQRCDFEWDGSLRDIYVLGTTEDDWRVVLDFIFADDFEAELTRLGQPVVRPENFASLLFREDSSYMLRFFVGELDVHCFFFQPEQIELTIDPREVTESSVRELLEFVVELGDLTKKRTVVTPENCPDIPIYSYSPAERELRYVPRTDS